MSFVCLVVQSAAPKDLRAEWGHMSVFSGTLKKKNCLNWSGRLLQLNWGHILSFFFFFSFQRQGDKATLLRASEAMHVVSVVITAALLIERPGKTHWRWLYLESGGTWVVIEKHTMKKGTTNYYDWRLDWIWCSCERSVYEDLYRLASHVMVFFFGGERRDQPMRIFDTEPHVIALVVMVTCSYSCKNVFD